MRRKRFYATQYTDENYFYSRREANWADHQAREAQEEAEKKEKRRKRIARQRREAAEKKANSPEVLAAKAAAAEIQAKHEAEVRGVAVEREALNLNPEDYYARFITPLIDDMAERLSGGDAVKKAAYTQAAEYLLVTRNEDGGQDFTRAMQNNLWEGDGVFIREIGTYIRNYASSIERGYRVRNELAPVVNEVLDKVVSEKHYKDAESATRALGFQGWLEIPYVSKDYREQNRLDRRFGGGESRGSIVNLQGLIEMIAEVQKDPEAFKENLCKGLKDCAAYHQRAKEILVIRNEEVQSAFNKGWFPTERAAQSAQHGMRVGSGQIRVSELAQKLYDAQVDFADGGVSFDAKADGTAQALLENPEALRTEMRAHLANENAKIWKVKDLAGAYLHAAEVVSRQEESVTAIDQSITDIKEQGVFKRLLSVFTLSSLHIEAAEAKGDLQTARSALSELQQNFSDAKSGMGDYVASSDPQVYAAYAPDIVRAPVEMRV